MNDRIKELTGKALDQSMPQTWYGISPDDLDRIAATLAELIVRECLDQCYNRGMNDELYAGQLKAASYIEQHFGIEE